MENLPIKLARVRFSGSDFLYYQLKWLSFLNHIFKDEAYQLYTFLILKLSNLKENLPVHIYHHTFINIIQKPHLRKVGHSTVVKVLDS